MDRLVWVGGERYRTERNPEDDDDLRKFTGMAKLQVGLVLSI